MSSCLTYLHINDFILSFSFVDRSPEVLLGAPYTGAIDIWSLACVCAEMFLGLPLFPGVSQHNQLSRIVEMFGVPPDFLIESKNGSKYFTLNTSKDIGENITTSNENCEASSPSDGHAPSKYRIKTPEEYAAATNSAVPVLKKYLRYSKLEEVIMKCPVANKSKMTNEQKTVEMMKRKCFLDFLKGLFNLNPYERWTAKQAAGHPFITNAAYTGHYIPEPDKRNQSREADFFVQNQKYKYAHAPSTVASPLNTSLSRGKAPTIVEPAPSERGDVHQDESSFVMLKNSSRRQTEPVELHHHKAKRDSTSEDHSRPRLRRGNPVHMKQPGGDNSNNGQHNHLPSHYMQSNWQRGDDHSDNPQQPWQQQQQPPPPHLRLPIQQPYSGVGVSPSMHQSQLLPNGAFMSNQVPIYPPSPYAQYGSPQTWISTSQGSYPHNYPPNMIPSNGCMTLQQGIPIHAHPQVMFPVQYQVASATEGYYASPPNSYTMIPGQHLPHPNGTSSSGYVAMGSSVGSSLMYGSNSSMIEGNAMVMTDFGLALLRPEVNENRMLHSQTYFMQQQQQHMIQNQYQQQHSPGSMGSMGMFTPYGSISSSLQRPLYQPSSSFGNNSYSNTSGGNSFNMQQHTRSKAPPVSQASSYERRPRGGSLSNSTMDHSHKRRDAPQFHEYEALLGAAGAQASSLNTRASSNKDSQYKSSPETIPPGSSEGTATERSSVGKSIVAKTDLDKSNSTVSSRETRMQDDYVSNGLSNSESTHPNYNASNHSRSTNKEKAKSSSSIVRVNSSDSLVNVDPTTEAIADWDPFFSADDISHEDDGSGRRLDDASDEEQT